MSLSLRLSSVLIPLALGGCATQETVAPANIPQDRLDRLEQMVLGANDPGRYAALEREIAVLRETLARLDARSAAAEAARERAAEDGRTALARIEQDQHTALARIEQEQRAIAERLARDEQRLDTLDDSMRKALALASQEYLRLNGKEAFTVALREDRAMYPINSPELASGDLARLDELMTTLAGLGQAFHLEIQGHTDNFGSEDYNYALGKARAEVVKRYLHERKGVPLSQMSVISFGSSRPADTAAGGNRHILVRVLVPK